MEKLVLSAFIHDIEYNSTVIQHIKSEFFEDESLKVLLECALEYSNEHKKLPPKIVIETLLHSKLNLPQVVFENASNLLSTIYSDENKSEISEASIEWKLDKTLQWFKERAAFNTILLSLEIIEGKYKENGIVVEKSAIPELMQKAISISFDTSIGHDYFEDAEERYEFMHTKLNKIAFKIPLLNKITNGGIERGTINIGVAPPHSGKTLFMGSLAVDWASLGYNVLVITLEMAEMKIGERIDANVLDIDIDQLKNVPKKNYLDKMRAFEETKGYGKIIVKQYPTSAAGASHFRFLMTELKNKQNYVPDVVVIDYLGICASARFKKSDNMYQIQKAVGEEIRALAVEQNVAIWTCVQTNKDGVNASDFNVTDVSECLDPNSIVQHEVKGKIKLKEVEVGDRILGSFGYTTVQIVHHPKVKMGYKIRLKSGKEIICSSEHVFPTKDGRKCINDGLAVGIKLRSME